MSRRKAFWILFGVTFAFYFGIVGWSLPAISEAAGGLATFDLRPQGYSFEEATAFLAALSTAGYGYYLDIQHSLDLFYPGLYAATVFFAIAGLAPPAWGNARFVLALVAVPAAVFDYLENSAVGAMLRAGADLVSPDMVATASRWTVLKSSATVAGFLVILVLLALKLAARIRQWTALAPVAAPGPINRFGERVRKWTGS